MGWSVDGAWVEVTLRALVVTRDEHVAHRTFLGDQGEWPFPINGRAYRIARVKTFWGRVTELYSHDGGLVPETARFVDKVLAPAGSTCARHVDVAASVACARCGTFACAACLGPDVIHCRGCEERLFAEANDRPREGAYFAPAALFVAAGGLVGGALGLGAAAASVAIARRVQNKPLRAVIAVGLYGLAAIVYLLVAAIIDGGRDALHR